MSKSALDTGVVRAHRTPQQNVPLSSAAVRLCPVGIALTVGGDGHSGNGCTWTGTVTATSVPRSDLPWLPAVATDEHWNDVYASRGEHVSWFRPTLERSLAIIDGFELGQGATAIDVGSGSSTLVDGLLDRGFAEVTVLDLSRVALDTAAARLGPRSDRVRFVVGDVTAVALRENAYDLWHDRAVFHFLTEPAARAAYVRQVLHALRPGGRIIVATFGPEGPERCSGLPVVRYDENELHAAFGQRAFEQLGHERETHQTPWGSEQEFVYCYCRCAAC
jgi:SAM-dependent methyltransferase